jgi:hypothetical protein
MNMKSITGIAILASICAGGMVGMHGSALAFETTHGALCKPYGKSTVDGLNSLAGGVLNQSGRTLSVVCPVIRRVQSLEGDFSVWVDGAASEGTASCAMYSYHFTGRFLGSTSFSATGVFDHLLTLPPGAVQRYSSQVVFCTLPPNGKIFDIEPVEVEPIQ